MMIVRMLLCLLVLSQCIYGDLDTTYKCGCRILAVNKDKDNKPVYERGSGFFFKETEDYYYILTCAHVVKEDKNPKIAILSDGLYHGSFITKTFYVHTGEEIYKDFAILQIKKDCIDTRPTIIPLSKVNPNIGVTLIALGHPMCTYTRVGLVTVIDNNNNCTDFVPTCVPGDSGGPITSLDSSEVYGVTSYTCDGIGSAISTVYINDVINKNVKFQ